MLSNLTAEQRNSLQAMPQVLGLAADIAHAAVTIYLPGENKKFFNVYKQEQPMTQVGNVRPDMTGRRVRAVEEPLVARVLQKNVPVNGKREWALGMFNSLKVFPLRDSRGHCYGAVSFESAAPDDIIIAQSLELLCNLRQDLSNNSNYQRLRPSDGIMVVDANRVIVAANNRARHMFDVMDISHLVGCRTNDVAINWPLVGMVMETGTAESKERLQERRAQCDETKIVLRDCVNRVNSIAIVHEYLSQQDTGLIDVGKVAKGIYQAIISSMLNPEFILHADFKADPVQLPSDKATSIALILNELLQNTIEHAYEGRMSGSLKVRFAEESKRYVLSIADDGVGLPEGFSLNSNRQSLGLKIIKTMAEADLQGSFSLTNREDGGTLALVTIPKGGLEDVK